MLFFAGESLPHLIIIKSDRLANKSTRNSEAQPINNFLAYLPFP